MSLQSRKGNPAVAWACVIIIAVIINDHVSSAPVAVTLEPPTPSQKMDFYENLYNNTSNCSAFLPTMLERSYIKTKVNNACNDTDTGSLKQENLSSVCNSLSNLFPKLCHSNAVNLKVNRLLKPTEISMVDINKFCTALKKTITNVTESSPKDEVWIIPFMESNREMQRQMDASKCEEYCLNVPTPEFQSDKEIRINPTCALLLRGFKIYRQLNQGTVSQSSTEGDGETIPAERSNINKSKELIPSASEPEQEAINEIVADKDKKDMRLPLTRPDIRTNLSTVKKENESISNASKSNIMENMEIPVALESTATRPETSQKTRITVDAEVTEEETETKQTLDDKTKPLSTNIAEANNTGKQNSNALNDEAVKSAEKEKINETEKAPPGLSTSTTTTTTATVDLERLNGGDGPAPPIEKDELKSKRLSSTAAPAPKTNDLVSDDDDDTKDPENVEGAGVEVADDNPPNVVSKPVVSKFKSGQKVKPKPNSTTKNSDEDAFASLQEDDTVGIEYNPGGETGIAEEPVLKKSHGDDVGGNDVPIVENRGYDSSGGRYSNNGYGGAVFEHGTTINVSLNEAEDTGFFNYFLCFVILVGILYFVIHNKKKLIAYVMEGKRPRSRSRRSSSSGSGQYKRLENNYD